jgi:hypothetical protein
MYLHCLACIQFYGCVFLTILLLGNNVFAARAQAKTTACIGSAFVGRFHGQVASYLGSRLCFLQGRRIQNSASYLLFVLFGCSFSRTPAEHSLICLALSHAAPAANW